MAAPKKIVIEYDIDGKPINVAIDATLNLKQQVRELTKEIAKTKEGTAEFQMLSTKLGDVNDQLGVSNAKSKDLFGSLSLLPGPVGEFANAADGAITTLKTFSSFSFKDLKFQLGETLNDFKDIAGSIGKATGITKIYESINNGLAKSFVAVGIGETAAATGAKAFAAALTATGIGAIVVALGMAYEALKEFITGEEEAKAATEAANQALESQAEILNLDLADAARRQKKKLSELKAGGASEADIRAEQLKNLQENLKITEAALKENYASQNKIMETGNGDLKKAQDDGTKLEQKAKDLRAEIYATDNNNKAEANKERLAKEKEAQQKLEAANKQHREKIAADNKTADEALLTLQRENAVLAIQDQRKREDEELKNAKLSEEDKIKALMISAEKKAKIIAQIETKYKAKQKDVDKKRAEDDLKEAKDYADKLEEIRIQAIANQQEREKAELQKGYNKTKEDLDKALADKKISQEQYNIAILNMNATLAAGIKRIDDAKEKEDVEKRIKKLDDELKFLQIKGEALMAGTKEFYENQRAILNAAEQRELADKELTEAQKTAIEEKYTALRKKLKEQEIAAQWAVASQTIDAVAKLTGAIASSYDEEAKTSKAAFEQRKSLQKATAVMSAASGIIQILTQPSTLPSPFDWITKGINAAALAISTAVQIKNIDNTQFGGGASGSGSSAPTENFGKAYAEGGIIEGPRHAQGGALINAEGGEAIMTRGAVTMFAPLLSALNQAGGGTSFAQATMGGANYDAPKLNTQPLEPQIIKTYVVENELTNAQTRQARLKNLSTL